MRPSLNPDRRIGRHRQCQVLPGLTIMSEPDAGDAPSIVPYAGLPGHLAARVVLQHGEPLGEEPSASAGWWARLAVAPASSRTIRFRGYMVRRPCRTRERIGVALFPVVEQYESKQCVGSLVGLRRGALFDHRQPAFLAAAESCDVGHDPHRQRQGRDQIAIGPDDQAGFLALWIELQHAFLLVVALTGGPEAGQQTSFDRGDVGRLQPQRRAEVVVRLRILRSALDARLRQPDGLGDLALELRVELDGRLDQIDARPRDAAKVVIHRYRAPPEQDVEPDRRGESAMIGGIGRIGHDDTAQELQRDVVVEIVGKVGGAGSHFAARFGAHDQRQQKQQPRRNHQWRMWLPPSHEDYDSRGAAHSPLCPRRTDAAW